MSRRLAAVAVAALICVGPLAPDTGAVGGQTFKGKTAQKFRIQLSVEPGSVTLVRVKVRLRCLDGGVLYDDLSDFQFSPLRSRGRFADLQYGTTDVVRWRGRVRKGSVRGKLRVRDRGESGATCDSGFVGFATKPAHG